MQHHQQSPQPLHRTPGDILTIGFTSRCVLIVVLRDSLTLCYDLLGKSVLPPFYALTSMQGNHHPGSPSSRNNTRSVGGMDLLEANVYEGGRGSFGC